MKWALAVVVVHLFGCGGGEGCLLLPPHERGMRCAPCCGLDVHTLRSMTVESGTWPGLAVSGCSVQHGSVLHMYCPQILRKQLCLVGAFEQVSRHGRCASCSTEYEAERAGMREEDYKGISCTWINTILGSWGMMRNLWHVYALLCAHWVLKISSRSSVGPPARCSSILSVHVHKEEERSDGQGAVCV